jgi:putative salt-induced outer membrane protein
MKNTKFLALAVAGVIGAASNVAMAEVKEDGQWRGAFAGSLALASGNTKSTNLSLAADGVRATKEDKISLYLTSLYGTNDTGGTTNKTANLLRAGGKYDWNLSDRSYAFGTLDLENDKIQGLDRRTVIGAGLGYKVIKEKDTNFEVFGGITSNSEKYKFSSRTSSELLLGEQSDHKLSESTTFKQRFAIYPNLKDSGKNRSQFDASLVTAIASGISMQFTLAHRQNSAAPAGTKKGDTLFLTGINIALGAK